MYPKTKCFQKKESGGRKRKKKYAYKTTVKKRGGFAGSPTFGFTNTAHSKNIIPNSRRIDNATKSSQLITFNNATSPAENLFSIMLSPKQLKKTIIENTASALLPKPLSDLVLEYNVPNATAVSTGGKFLGKTVKNALKTLADLPSRSEKETIESPSLDSNNLGVQTMVNTVGTTLALKGFEMLARKLYNARNSQHVENAKESMWKQNFGDLPEDSEAVHELSDSGVSGDEVSDAEVSDDEYYRGYDPFDMYN